MGISAFVRDKLPLDDICVCVDRRRFCDCAVEFADVIDPDWRDHCFDEWSYIRDYRRFAPAEEWNSAVADWRASCGVE
jgi:hypothetical protein